MVAGFVGGDAGLLIYRVLFSEREVESEDALECGDVFEVTLAGDCAIEPKAYFTNECTFVCLYLCNDL